MRGATKDDCQVVSEQVISIHAPHARSDSRSTRYQTRWTYFNPRSSCEERPSDSTTNFSMSSNFNPRSSCEERLVRMCRTICTTRFQSTLLMRGATPARLILAIYSKFQSTLLMRGATLKASAIGAVTLHFNPRSSCEERLGYLGRTAIENNFNPRSSCEERHDRRAIARRIRLISIHAPHARSDPTPPSK